MFFKKTVVLTTFSQLLPAAWRIAVRLFSTRSVCSAMPPEIRLPVAGSNATWPEMKTNPLALMACEYGPMAFGAWGVETGSRVEVIMGVFLTHSKRSEETLPSWLAFRWRFDRPEALVLIGIPLPL